jgi:hypothetical protein
MTHRGCSYIHCVTGDIHFQMALHMQDKQNVWEKNRGGRKLGDKVCKRLTTEFPMGLFH